MPVVLREIIYGPAVAGVAAAVIVLQLAVVIVAARRRGRPPLPMKVHAIAAGAIAAIALAAGISAHVARSIATQAFAATDNPLGAAIGLLVGVAGQIRAMSFGIGAVLLAATLWLAGVAITLAATRPDQRPRTLPPVALVAVGLLPIAYGALRWSAEVTLRFSTTSDIPVEDRATVIARTLDVARAHLTHAAYASTIAIVVLAIVAIAAIAVHDRRRV